MIRAFAGSSHRLPPSVGFRPERDPDEPFLRALYSSTREKEMALVDWPDEEKEAFLAMQFEAQHRHYLEHFPEADYLVIEKDGAAVGRIYLHRQSEALRLIDIALLPEARNMGLGGALLKDLLDEGQASGIPVRIHVEKFNPAMRLYLRLGFTTVKELGVYELLEWRPATS